MRIHFTAIIKAINVNKVEGGKTHPEMEKEIFSVMLILQSLIPCQQRPKNKDECGYFHLDE